VLAAAVVAALWLIVGQSRGPGGTGQATAPVAPTTSVETTAETTGAFSSTSSNAPAITLPGTDDLGFIGYPAARCDPGSQPAVLARTAKSVLVVCRTQAGSYYYRGLRLSDNASIELANAVRSSGGFDVTNPTDGTRYQIRSDALTITPPNGQAAIEPMVAYASS
ncbi:MAG: serine/threonine protein kinase, partial [Mycobacteriaceae bacterium]|nr:serine/threonine protein kinase [Mycobacteriaceae bacterium]